MSIRKTILENPNGIFNELPSKNDINNQEDVKEDPEQEEFIKKLKSFPNTLIVKQSAEIQNAAKREAERLKLRGQSMSVGVKTEQNLMQYIPNSGEAEVKSGEAELKSGEAESKSGETSPLPAVQLTLSPESTNVNSEIILTGQPFSSSSQGFGSQQLTQVDIEGTPPLSPSSEPMIPENQRMQEQSSVASSTTSIPSRGPISNPNYMKDTTSSKAKKTGSTGNKSPVSKRKRGTGGSRNKVTSKHYKNSNNNYSVKNKQPSCKSKTIKHNKRKHTKTYKRK